jgi:hypothetical protein
MARRQGGLIFSVGADLLVVLDRGQVAEKGTHQELLRLDGIYARLWQHQSGGFLDDDTTKGLKDRTAAQAALESRSLAAHRVGWGFISLYTLAYMSTNLLFLAPCWSPWP